MSASALNPEQFGMKPYSADLEREVGDALYKAGRIRLTRPSRPTTKRISLTNMRASQPDLSKTTYNHYLRNGPAKDQEGDSNRADPPIVIRHQGENVVWGGHHRVAAALTKGQKRMTVEYRDSGK